MRLIIRGRRSKVKWFNDDYDYRTSIMVNVKEIIKSGLKFVVGNFPLHISRKNGSDFIITHKGKKVEYTFGFKDIHFEKKNKIIIDEGWDNEYMIFIPLPKGYKGKDELIYYIYYKQGGGGKL